MKCAMRACGTVSTLILIASCSVWCQKVSPDKQQAGTESIGDAVRAQEKATGKVRHENPGAMTRPVTDGRPIHILYMHGINQVGAGDSMLLRKGICKYLGECTVTSLGRVYADGPFAVDSAPPTLAYMGEPIWKSQDEWSASAPFIDRYRIEGNGHTPIILDEFNWWPLAYPLKCKWLIAHDSRLTGPSKSQLDTCAAATTLDTAHPGRYLNYRWINTSEASNLNHISRRAMILNRSLKSGLMDWGFGDAVMALGPMEEVLSAGIRELLIKSLQSSGADLRHLEAEEVEVFFVTHSLGSYLSLVALNSDLLGPQDPELSRFQITPEQRQAADYFSAHTAGFYFLANQVALLQLARVTVSTEGDAHPCPTTSVGTPAAPSIAHWRCKRELYLRERASVAHMPQIVAWTDPDDLLSWEVPEIEGVHVVNIPVRNPGFKIPPFIESPTSAHANYAKNRKVIGVILKPSVEQ